jgi:hypothetical protein
MDCVVPAMVFSGGWRNCHPDGAVRPIHLNLQREINSRVVTLGSSDGRIRLTPIANILVFQIALVAARNPPFELVMLGSQRQRRLAINNFA